MAIRNCRTHRRIVAPQRSHGRKTVAPKVAGQSIECDIATVATTASPHSLVFDPARCPRWWCTPSAGGDVMSRRTKAEMDRVRQAIVELAEEHQPCTVRNIYYRGIGPGFWPKDQGRSTLHYDTTVRLAGLLRESGRLPWEWITDGTRWVRRQASYRGVDDALRQWSSSYRRDLWESQPRRVEVWCESDSISGVLADVTLQAGLGLYVCRGQASKTFIHEAVDDYLQINKPVTILFIGDWDPSGLGVDRSLAERIERYSHRQPAPPKGVWFRPDPVEPPPVELVRVALTEEDVRSGDVLTHAVNKKDSQYPRFAADMRLMGLDPQTAVEVEALPPGELRQRLADAIDDLVEDPAVWNATLAAEESERDVLRRLAGGDTSAWTAP